MPKQKNSSYYLKKTFNEHHDKKLREQNTESNTNLDCEDGNNWHSYWNCNKNQGMHSVRWKGE